MEFLHGPWRPILEQAGSLPRNIRLASGALGLVLALGLTVLLRSRTETDYVPLWEGQKLSAPQAARMTSAFKKHGLQGAQVSLNEIQVPSRHKDAYLIALDAEQAWPADFDAPLDRALAGTNPLLSWQQNREQLARGEKQMLARIVEGLEGVETAAVQYDEVRQPGFPPKVEMRAMVAVRAEGGRNLDDEQIEAVRDTVVAFKGGLERRSVTITDLNACRAYPGSSAADASRAAARAQAAAKRSVEEEFRAKIEQRLAMYPGVVVAVHAHFVEDDLPSQAAAEDGSTPGPSLRLVLVNASLDLPRSYFRSVWQQRRGTSLPETPPAEELGQIEQEICGTLQRAVAALLPPPAPGWASQSLVTVTAFDELPVLSSPPPGPWQRRPGRWVLYASLLAVGGALVLGGVVQRRRRSRAVPDKRDRSLEPTQGVVGGHTELTLATLPGAAAEPGLAVLQDQLSTLVKRDPAAAAEVLKRWLKRAA